MITTTTVKAISQDANFARVDQRIVKKLKNGEIRNLIFDLDGVLVNSRKANKESTLAVIYKYGFKPHVINGSLETLCSRHSPEFILRELVPELKGKPEILRQMIRDLASIGLSNKELITRTPLAENLQIYQDMGAVMGVATNRKESAKPLIEHLEIGRHMVAIVNSLMAAEKPSPDMIKMLLGMMNADPKYTIFVGDNREDWMAGMDAGVQTILVHWNGN